MQKVIEACVRACTWCVCVYMVCVCVCVCVCVPVRAYTFVCVTEMDGEEWGGGGWGGGADHGIGKIRVETDRHTDRRQI